MFGRKPNTIKSLLTEKPKNCLENDDTLQLSPDDFPKDDDSTVFLRDKTKNTKLESQFKKKKGTITNETKHTITMDTNRGRQVISKRDVVKTKSASTSPKKLTRRGNSHSLERKIAALNDAEARSEMELNKPLKFFAGTDYKQKYKQKSQRSPRKQQKPRKSMSGLPEKNSKEIEELENSSDEETNPQPENPGPSTPKIEEKEQPTLQEQNNPARQSQRPKKKPNWYGQNVMVSKIEGEEKESKDKADETNSEQMRREIEEMPNFLEMTQEEIEDWINN